MSAGGDVCRCESPAVGDWFVDPLFDGNCRRCGLPLPVSWWGGSAAGLDNCPACGGRVRDFDDDGCELPTGQRWHVSHMPDELRSELGP